MLIARLISIFRRFIASRIVHYAATALIGLALFLLGLAYGRDWTPQAKQLLDRYAATLPVEVALGGSITFSAGWQPSLLVDTITITGKNSAPIPTMVAYNASLRFSWWDILHQQLSDATFGVERLEVILASQPVPITALRASVQQDDAALRLAGQYRWLDVPYDFTAALKFLPTLMGFDLALGVGNEAQTLSLATQIAVADDALLMNFTDIRTAGTAAKGFIALSMTTPHRLRSEWEVTTLDIGAGSFFGIGDLLRILTLFDQRSNGTLTVRAPQATAAGETVTDAELIAQFQVGQPMRFTTRAAWREQPLRAEASFLTTGDGGWSVQAITINSALGDARGRIDFSPPAETPLSFALTSKALALDLPPAASLGALASLRDSIPFPIRLRWDAETITSASHTLQPLRLDMTLKPREWQVHRLDGILSGMAFSTRGRIITTGLAPSLQLSIQTENGTPLPWLGDSAWLATFQQGEIILDGLLTNLSIRGSVKNPIRQLAWQGFIKDILATPRFEGTLALRDQRMAGGILLESPATLSAAAVQLSALTGQHGGQPIAGALALTFREPRSLKGQVQLGRISLLELMAMASPVTAVEPVVRGGLLDDRGCSTYIQSGWALTPVHPTGWLDMSVNVTLEAGQLDLFGIALPRSRISLTQDDGRLRLKATSAAHQVSLEAMPVQRQWQWRSEGRLVNYTLPPSRQGLSGGQVNAAWQVVSNGRCLGQLVERLSGRGEFTLQNSRYESPRLNSVVAVLQSFGINTTPTIASAQGTLLLQQGTATLQNTRARLGFALMTANGRLRLGDLQTELDTSFQLDAFPTAPPLRLISTGSLDALETRLGDTLFRDHLIRQGILQGLGGR